MEKMAQEISSRINFNNQTVCLNKTITHEEVDHTRFNESQEKLEKLKAENKVLKYISVLKVSCVGLKTVLKIHHMLQLKKLILMILFLSH